MSNEADAVRDTRPMRRIGVAGAVLVLGVLAGCAAAPPGGAPQPFSVPPADTAPPAGVAAAPTSVVLTPEEVEIYGPRVELPGGLLLKQIGKVAQYGGPDDTDSNTYGWRVVVDSIEVDPRCDEYTPKPTRGHRVLVTMRVETSATYDLVMDGAPQYYEWGTIAPDGVSEAPMSAYWACRQATELPNEMRPSAKYRGTVAVDTAYVTGQLVLANFAVYNYPQS